jgi:hypothetical protein
MLEECVGILLYDYFAHFGVNGCFSHSDVLFQHIL